MKILLADDHKIMRDAYKLLLRDKYKKAKFGEAGDTAQAIETALAQPWDVIIFDLFMPGGDGLEALKEIHAQRPMIPVLVVSAYEQRQYVLGSFMAGAMGYLSKSSASSELGNAVGHILAGGRYVDSKAADYLMSMALVNSRPTPGKKAVQSRQGDKAGTGLGQ